MEIVVDRSSLESVLRESATTVTSLLERLVGERIDADDCRNVMTSAATTNLLGVAMGYRLLERSSVLRGRQSAEPYVYAESLLAPDRLPQGFFRRLETSGDPIGRVLVDEGIDFSRTPLPCGQRDDLSLIHNSAPPDDCLLARRYRIEVDGLPVIVIAEWFLPALERFFPS
jgi:chorismate-pyruvate lyase